MVGPSDAVAELRARGAASAALVFGNESSGLTREHIDRCDLIVRIPTVCDFPVLNLTQAVAILLFHFTVTVPRWASFIFTTSAGPYQPETSLAA